MNTRFIYWIGIALMLASCEKEVVVEASPDVPRLVVYGVLYPDSVISVWVTHPKPVLDTATAQPVTGASVSIAEDDQAFVPLAYDAEQKRYRATFTPRRGAVYRLRVQADGFPDAEATTQVPVPTPIQAVTSRRIPTGLDPDCEEACPDFYQQYDVGLTWNDPAGEDNYYEVDGLIYYTEERLYYDSLLDEYFSFLARYEYSPRFFSNDPVLTDLHEPDQERYEPIRFSDQLFDGQTTTFDYEVRIDFEGQLQLKVILNTLHADLYRYTGSKQQQNEESLSFITEPVRVHQNITGGYGIFSSYSQDTVVIELD